MAKKKRVRGVKEAVFELLDELPDMPTGEIAAQVGCAPNYVSVLRSQWKGLQRTATPEPRVAWSPRPNGADVVESASAGNGETEVRDADTTRSGFILHDALVMLQQQLLRKLEAVDLLLND